MNKIFFLSLISCIIAHGSAYAMENYPLHEAVQMGDIEHVKGLLANSTREFVNKQDHLGRTALHYAAKRWIHAFAIVQYLLEGGANINQQSHSGDTALHFATRNGHQAIIKLLIEQGADVNISNHMGWTALHCATNKKNLEVIKIMDDWVQILKQRDVAAVQTLAMANHPRLGVSSSAKSLPFDGSVQKIVFKCLTNQK